MKKEKIVLSFFAALIGIIVAIIGFFVYQSTKEIKSSQIKKITISNPSPTPASGIFLTLDEPKNEEVVDKRIIKVSGKTIPLAKIVVITQSDENAAVADVNGNFSTEITLDEDQNILEVSAISKKGEITKVNRVVTYSTEDF